MIIIHQNIYFGYLGPRPPIINSGPASLKGAAQTVSLLNKTNNPLSPNWVGCGKCDEEIFRFYFSLWALHLTLLVSAREGPRDPSPHQNAHFLRFKLTRWDSWRQMHWKIWFYRLVTQCSRPFKLSGGSDGPRFTDTLQTANTRPYE